MHVFTERINVVRENRKRRRVVLKTVTISALPAGIGGA